MRYSNPILAFYAVLFTAFLPAGALASDKDKHEAVATRLVITFQCAPIIENEEPFERAMAFARAELAPDLAEALIEAAQSRPQNKDEYSKQFCLDMIDEVETGDG